MRDAGRVLRIAGAILIGVVVVSAAPGFAGVSLGQAPAYERAEVLRPDPTREGFGHHLELDRGLLLAAGDEFPVIVYELAADGTFEETARLTPPSTGLAGAQLDGLALDGRTAVVSGAAGVFVYEMAADGTWGEPVTLRVFESGSQVDVSGDTVVVSRRADVRVFERNAGGPGAWGLANTLVPDIVSEGAFAGGVAIEGDLLLANFREIGDAGVRDLTVIWTRGEPLRACATPLAPAEGCYPWQRRSARPSAGFSVLEGGLGADVARGGVTLFRPLEQGDVFVESTNPAVAQVAAIDEEQLFVEAQTVGGHSILVFDPVDNYTVPVAVISEAGVSVEAVVAEGGVVAVGDSASGAVRIFRLVESTATPGGAATPVPTASPVTGAATPVAVEADPSSTPGTVSPDALSTATAERPDVTAAASAADPGGSTATPEAAPSATPSTGGGDGISAMQVFLIGVGLIVVLSVGAFGGYLVSTRRR